MTPQQRNQITQSKEQKKYVDAIKDSLLVFAETVGRENGLEDKPDSVDELHVFVGNKIKNTLQTALYKNSELYTPISGMVQATEIRKIGKEKKQKLDAELGDICLEKNLVDVQRKPLFPDKKLAMIRKFIYALLVLLGVIEAVYAFNAFRSKGMDFLTSLSTGIGMAIACLTTHFLAKWCKNAPQTLIRNFRIAVSFIVPFLLFYSIALVRVDGYSAESQFKNLLPGNNPPPMSMSALDFFLISYVFYIIGFFLSYCFAKTTVEIEQEKEFNKLTEECNRLQSKENALKNQIREIEETTQQQSSDALENFEKAVATEQEIESIAPEVLQKYIEKNIRHRRNGIPPFFSSIPPFKFEKFFDTLKSNNHETH
jgi:hypothetical protein